MTECERLTHSLTLRSAQRRNKSVDERVIYHHVTCATDTENVQVVFNACKDIILRDNLTETGFID